MKSILKFAFILFTMRLVISLAPQYVYYEHLFKGLVKSTTEGYNPENRVQKRDITESYPQSSSILQKREVTLCNPYYEYFTKRSGKKLNCVKYYNYYRENRTIS